MCITMIRDPTLLLNSGRNIKKLSLDHPIPYSPLSIPSSHAVSSAEASLIFWDGE